MTDDLSRPRRRSRVWLWLAGAGALAAAAGAWQQFGKPRPPEPPAVRAQDGADPAVVTAVDQARQKVAAAPASAAAWGDLGMTFAAHGYEPEADRCFAEAERLDPANPRWPYFRGVFSAVHEPAAAVAHLRRAAAAGPGRSDAEAAVRLRLAESLADAAPAEAEALFREEVARQPDSPRARFGLGQLALAKGDAAGARREFEAIADSPFARKRAAIALAALAQAAGDTAAAAQYAETARLAPDDPSWPDPHLRQLRAREVGLQGLLREVEALEAAGQLPKATAMLVEMAESNPAPKVLVAAGINLAKQRDYVRAEGMFRACLLREPGHAQANYFLAVVLFERADAGGPDRPRLLREAAAHGRRAVTAKPDHGLAWLYLGRALSAGGETADAVAALRQAVACRPDLAEPHLYLAEAVAAAGGRDEAIRHAENAEKLAKPGDTRPDQLLGRLRKK